MKSFLEMMEVDISAHTSSRKAKDENGRMVDIEYLPWASCKLLLHKEGCKVVDFEPLATPEGSYVFASREVTDKNGASNGCYFVKVRITIDDLVFDYAYPLMNGNLVVRDETLNQLRISNAHARAFVKGVAVKTGLGYSLWLKDDESTKLGEDLSIHDIMKVKQRVGELLTEKVRKCETEEALCDRLGIKVGQLYAMMKWFEQLHLLETKLKGL